MRKVLFGASLTLVALIGLLSLMSATTIVRAAADLPAWAYNTPPPAPGGSCRGTRAAAAAGRNAASPSRQRRCVHARADL